jgi:hypothetical protein
VKIKTFAYVDLKYGWTLDEAHLEALNLLVGISGVGKTRIIEALREVVLTGSNEYNAAPLARWKLSFEHVGALWHWEAETEEGSNGNRSKSVFVCESLRRNDDDVVRRTRDQFVYAQHELPKMNPTASALHILAGEAAVEPVVDAMKHVVFSLFTGDVQEPGRPFRFAGEGNELLDRMLDADRTSAARGQHFEVEAGEDVHGENRDNNFCEMFSSVEDLRVQRDTSPTLRVEIRERAGGWIPQQRISSGMLKTLVFLCELDVTPAGSVIVIDEFESSLGLNCLPEVTDALCDRGDCQFVVTSHHPYVINNISMEHWKLVEREGAVVRVMAARDIPALGGASHHEAFLRLINVDQYVRGVR